MSYIQPATQLTSRAALCQEDGLESILSSHHEQGLDQEVQRLRDIVRHSLGNFEVCPKRRKSDNTPTELVDLEATDAPFRLISWSLPPRRIRFGPDHHSSVRHQRPAEDTLDEAQLRQIRAQEAAVDADCILTDIRRSNPKAISTIASLTPVVTGTNTLQLPRLLVTKLSATQGDENNSGHGHVRCCSLVPLTDQSSSDKTKRKRKRVRQPVRDRTCPTFFRPMEEWGGKSAGYAMGWQGSRPTNRLKSRQYARDKMRKGTQGNPTR